MPDTIRVYTWSICDTEGVQRTGISEEEMGALLSQNAQSGNFEVYFVSENNEGQKFRTNVQMITD